MATKTHDSFDLAKQAHLDNRLQFVANAGSLPSVSDPYIYFGAIIFVEDEGCNYCLSRINGAPTWVPMRPIYLRTTAIYTANIAAAAVGTEYFLRFNTSEVVGIDDSKMIGDKDIILDPGNSYNPDYNDSIGAVNLQLNKNGIYQIKAHFKVLTPRASDFRFRIYLNPALGTVANPAPGQTLIVADSKNPTADAGLITFTAEAIIKATNQNSVIAVGLNTGSDFTGVTAAAVNSEIQANSAHQSILGALEIIKLGDFLG